MFFPEGVRMRAERGFFSPPTYSSLDLSLDLVRVSRTDSTQKIIPITVSHHQHFHFVEIELKHTYKKEKEKQDKMHLFSVCVCVQCSDIIIIGSSVKFRKLKKVHSHLRCTVLLTVQASVCTVHEFRLQQKMSVLARPLAG
jgi:hypothetical protein